MNPLTLDLRPLLRLTHREFEQIAAANRDLRLELTADGELIVMPPTGGNTGRRNADLTYQLQAWSRQTQLEVRPVANLIRQVRAHLGKFSTPLLCFNSPMEQDVLLMQLGLAQTDGTALLLRNKKPFHLYVLTL
ncbi:hypothetical protein LYNGBM3L_60780 [Moorena producens 3L]|uniref:Putative restriction endonuclease domain-containing protein n=1 Tax=Moorena producens 3L TaxID=489825 RepID=F4Y0F1_9CYAN|nr:hypothetical protein LYNGBM3L_60780 [Moorena producens 3L]